MVIILSNADSKLDGKPSLPGPLRGREKIRDSTWRTIHYELHIVVTAHPAHSEENQTWRQ
jgi:hypothetical protein